LNSFVGEFMTLLGAWERAPVLAAIGAIGLVLGLSTCSACSGAMYGEPIGRGRQGISRPASSRW